MKYRVLESCASPTYAYRLKQELTLGVDITDADARDLLRAGHIEVLEQEQEVERATAAPTRNMSKPTVTRKPTAKADITDVAESE